jgi:hypothetical protein
VLHTLSLSLQMSDPESDALVPRLVDILVRVGDFTVKERMLALRCISVLELDDSETIIFQRALVLTVRFCSKADGSQELLILAIALMCKYASDLSPSTVNDIVIPSLLKLVDISAGSSPKLLLACVGLIHLLLENKPDSIHALSIPRIISVFVDRIGVSSAEPGCGCTQACEICQGCLSCILRVGVHPVMRESLRPFMNVLIGISFRWKSGSPIAAQSLLNMMAGLLH